MLLRIVKWERVYATLLNEKEGMKIVYLYPIKIGTVY